MGGVSTTGSERLQRHHRSHRAVFTDELYVVEDGSAPVTVEASRHDHARRGCTKDGIEHGLGVSALHFTACLAHLIHLVIEDDFEYTHTALREDGQHVDMRACRVGTHVQRSDVTLASQCSDGGMLRRRRRTEDKDLALGRPCTCDEEATLGKCDTGRSAGHHSFEGTRAATFQVNKSNFGPCTAQCRVYPWVGANARDTSTECSHVQ